MAQISQNILHQIFNPPNSETNPSGPYESYKTNLISKKNLNKGQDIESEDILVPKNEVKANKIIFYFHN